MGKFSSGIKSMVADSHNDSISSKRVVVFLCVIMMIVGFVANVGYGVEVSEHIYTAIMYVVLAGVGLTGIEKFAQQSSNTGAECRCPVPCRRNFCWRCDTNGLGDDPQATEDDDDLAMTVGYLETIIKAGDESSS